MTNLPKELEEIRDNSTKAFRNVYYNIGHHDGFNDCYQSMLKTHVPKEKVNKFIRITYEFLEHHGLPNTQLGIEFFKALKEFGSENG